MKKLLKNSVLKKWVKQSCAVGFVAMPLALAACATDDDDDTRDFDLGDGTFRLTKIEGSSSTFELNEGSTFGVEVDWVKDSAFNFKYVGEGSINVGSNTLKMSCDSDKTGKLQWKKINGDGIVEEIGRENAFLATDCPVGFADMFSLEDFASIKIITKDIEDGFHVELKNNAVANTIVFKGVNGQTLVDSEGFQPNASAKLYFLRP